MDRASRISGGERHHPEWQGTPGTETFPPEEFEIHAHQPNMVDTRHLDHATKSKFQSIKRDLDK